MAPCGDLLGTPHPSWSLLRAHPPLHSPPFLDLGAFSGVLFSAFKPPPGDNPSSPFQRITPSSELRDLLSIFHESYLYIALISFLKKLSLDCCFSAPLTDKNGRVLDLSACLILSYPVSQAFGVGCLLPPLKAREALFSACREFVT